MSCDNDWTEVDSLQLESKDISEVNPELYQEYLENLRAYKESNHKRMLVSFDNNNKTPFSKAHHIESIPDSVDVVSLQFPMLEEWELKEMKSVQENKGTKFILTVSFEGIKNEYQLMVNERNEIIDNLEEGEEEPEELPTLTSFIVQQLNSSILLIDKFKYDGLAFSYLGKSINHMSDREKSEYLNLHNAFIGVLNDWVGRNQDRLFIFEGKPQNLLRRDFLLESDYVVIPCTDVNSTSGIEYNVNSALVDEVPTDRFIVAIETTSLDESDTKTGVWDSGQNAVMKTSEWSSGNFLNFSVSGMMINNVDRDYYSSNRIYDYTRNAIDIINPAIKN